MKNFVQAGNVLSLIAPYALTSGDGFQVGTLFAVATSDALVDEVVEGSTVGVYALTKKASDVVTQGLDLYWDNTNKEVTITASTHLKIGQATLAAAGADATVNVRLNF